MFQKLTPREPLPSLNALRAFEAMARAGGATAAAAELHVTHSAVSRQVKALERSLGVRLFDGPRNQLQLTAEGRALLADLTGAFDTIAGAVRRLRQDREVRVAVHASLAVKWLIPRLPDFERLHPGVTVHLSDLPTAAVRERDADLVVRFMYAAALGPRMERLAENRVGLVCAPELVGDIQHAARLFARSHPGGWADWTAATGRPAPAGPTRPFAHLHFVLDAAQAGLGAAVLPWILVQEAVRTGRLAAPYGFVPDGGFLVAVRMSSDTPAALRSLVRWLREQATGSRQA
jgi:DNA-binding transcriptional LysR family regulator